MTLRDTSTDLRTGGSRLSGREQLLAAAVKVYALAGQQSGVT
jgi:hypothetical protein